MTDRPVIPAPALVVLVGPAGSGKSTWADALVGSRGGVVSTDSLRGLVGEGDDDIAASADAFALLDELVARRVGRRLTTVVDSLGFDAERRAAWRSLAAAHKMPCIAVCFDTAPALCRARNKARARVVPAGVVDGQISTYAALRPSLVEEPWDDVIIVTQNADAPVATPRLVSAAMARSTALVDKQAASPTQLRFGLQIPVFTWPGGPAEIGERLRIVARTAEEVGFESIWVMDHMRQIPMFGPAWLDMLECFTTLSHLAAVTSKVRLGPLVAGITHRNVAMLGKTVATLDVLSGGRAVCGLGAAWFASEHAAYGWPFPPLKERYAVLEDALRFLPLLWGPGSPSFEGRTFAVPDASCYPRPLRPRVPLLVGGAGEKQTLRLVAAHADACNLIGDAAFVARKLEVLHAHCDRLDRDPSSIEVTQLSTTLAGRDDAEVSRLVEAHRPRKSSVAKYAASVNAGTVEDQIGRFRELADAGVQTAIVSLPNLDGTPDAIERLAPVIAAFAV